MSRRTIEGKFEIIGEQGTGAMGQVFRAIDTSLDRPVALKFLKPELTGNDKARARFQSEMKRLAKLDHPNLAKIHASGQDNGQSFMVMEFIDGPSLEEILERGPMQAGVAIEILREVLSGIEHAHANGVVHRDLKPSNILLTRDGHPKVIDFGIGLDQDSKRLTTVGDVNCTAAYASPEQASGRTDEIDRQSDVYSIGAVLFEMLTGNPPLEKDSMFATLHAHVNEDVPPLPEHFGYALVTTVSTSLAREKTKRYRSTGEFKAALETAVPPTGKEADSVKEYISKVPPKPSPRPTVMETPSSDLAGGTPKPRGSGLRRVSWIVYATGGVLVAAAAIGLWVLKEVRELSGPISPPTLKIQTPLPPKDWDLVPLKPTPQPPPVITTTPRAPHPAAMSADERAALEARRASAEAALKKNSAELKSLKALGENPPRQAVLEKLIADSQVELDSIEKSLAAR